MANSPSAQAGQPQGSLVVARHLTRLIGSATTGQRILDDVSFSIPRLSMFAINGPSGSGKSTLLNLMTGIDHPTTGEIVVGGDSLAVRGENALARWRGRHVGITDALGASVVERRRDIGLFRSLGASGRRIAVVFWIEGLTLSAGAWILASAAGFPLAYLSVQRFSRTVMPTDFHVAPLTFAASIGGTLVIATVATALPARRAARMRAVELLRAE